MKLHLLFCMIAIVAVAYANAQQIAVVAPGGATTTYTDLNLAINGATAGSTVYLSGDAFIRLVTDTNTGLTDGTFTVGDDIRFDSEKIRIAPDCEADLGVFFVWV